MTKGFVVRRDVGVVCGHVSKNTAAIFLFLALLCGGCSASSSAQPVAGHRHDGTISDAGSRQAEEIDYEAYMEKLVQLARKNPSAPFAAMIIDTETGEILCQGLNYSPQNPTYHGEIVALNHCVDAYPYKNYAGTALITTAEPCSMCASAIVWAGIPEIVYGTSIPFVVEQGWGQIEIRAEQVMAASASFYTGKVVGGVLRAQTDPLFVRGK